MNNQLDAQFFFLYLFIPILYMFRAISAHHQESQLYQYNLRYMSLYVGNGVVCRSHRHLHRVTYTRGCINTIDTPDDENLIAQNM